MIESKRGNVITSKDHRSNLHSPPPPPNHRFIYLDKEIKSQLKQREACTMKIKILFYILLAQLSETHIRHAHLHFL